MSKIGNMPWRHDPDRHALIRKGVQLWLRMVLTWFVSVTVFTLGAGLLLVGAFNVLDAAMEAGLPYIKQRLMALFDVDAATLDIYMAVIFGAVALSVVLIYCGYKLYEASMQSIYEHGCKANDESENAQ
ncbi:hypothetical protein ACYPKM_00620 [Pseudomonas aeruginosa]